MTHEQLSERIQQRAELPFSVWDGKVRLSIAGYQDKVAVYQELLKVFRAKDIRQVPSTTTWRAQTIEMVNQKSGHTTVIVYGPFVINKGVSDDTFSIRELERER